MILRTTVRVALSFALLSWSVTRLAPAAARSDHLAIQIGLLLIAAGAGAMAARIFARPWLEACTARAEALWGYAPPAWVRDLAGLVLVIAGLSLVAMRAR